MLAKGFYTQAEILANEDQLRRENMDTFTDLTHQHTHMCWIGKISTCVTVSGHISTYVCAGKDKNMLQRTNQHTHVLIGIRRAIQHNYILKMERANQQTWIAKDTKWWIGCFSTYTWGGKDKSAHKCAPDRIHQATHMLGEVYLICIFILLTNL